MAKGTVHPLSAAETIPSPGWTVTSPAGKQGGRHTHMISKTVGGYLKVAAYLFAILLVLGAIPWARVGLGLFVCVVCYVAFMAAKWRYADEGAAPPAPCKKGKGGKQEESKDSKLLTALLLLMLVWVFGVMPWASILVGLGTAAVALALGALAWFLLWGPGLRFPAPRKRVRKKKRRPR